MRPAFPFVEQVVLLPESSFLIQSTTLLRKAE